MRKKFETHPTRCDYNEQELEAYFNAKKTLYMEGDKSPTIKQIKEKVNNILGYIPDNFTKYMIQMMTREAFKNGI